MPAVRPTRTRMTGALAALALGAALNACGSEEPDSADDLPPDSASASSSTPAGGSSSTAGDDPATSEEPSPIDDGAQVDAAAFVKRLQAGIDNTEQAHIEFTMGGAGGEMTGNGDVDYTVEPPNMQMTMEIGPETLGMLLVDEMIYVQSSQAGDKYLRYDLTDPTNPLGAGLSEQLDPAGSMKTFAKAVTSVTSSGKEDVEGQSLDRYVLTVDTTELADEASAAALPPQMQITVWLDRQDRMVKTFMDMGAIQYDATLSDFDRAVELKAPPKDQIATPPAA